MSAVAKRSLGELIELDIDEVHVIDTDEYRIAGVYGFGRGLFERGPIAGSETSYKKLHRLHAGQLVVSRLKAFEGALAVIPDAFEGWCLSPEFPTFRCVDGKLSPNYLGYISRWPEFWSMLAATSRGVGARRERVHAKDVLGIRLRVPPIEEQVVVASRLDKLHEAVTHKLDPRNQKTKSLLTSLRDAGLRQLLTELRDRTREVTTLGDLGTWSSGGTPSAKEPSFYGGGIPWAVIGDLNDGLVTETERSLTQLGLDRSSAKVVGPGTVLVAMYGSIGKLGIAAVDLATNQAIATCKPREGVSSEFLFSLLRCLRLELVELGQGGAQQNISQGLLKSLTVPKPASLEQAGFVDKVRKTLAQIDQAERLMRRARDLSRSLVPAALNESFAEIS